MMTPIPRRTAGLALALALALPAGAQDDERSPERQLARQREYLAHSPLHDAVFDQMVETAATLGGLDALIESYEKDLAAAPGTRATEIVLVRLLARAGHRGEALARLAALPDRDAPLVGLEAELLLRAGRAADALAALGAAPASTDPDVARDLCLLRADAHLALAADGEAAAALRDMAAVEPDAFHGRVEVADLAEERGLFELALEEYGAAERLAADPEQVTRVRVAIGELHERRLEGDLAVEAYRRAGAELLRGHWRKRDLDDRILRLHRRSGQLGALARAYRADMEREPRELAPRESLARVLVEVERFDEARAVYEDAVRDFPQDLDLALAHAELLRTLELHDELVLELQRAMRLDPEDPELAFRLGEAFLAGGRVDQALLQWERLAERRPDDAELHRRIALVWEAAGDGARAALALERAVAIDPDSIGRWADLADALDRFGREGEADEVLLSAESRFAGSASALDALAERAVARKDHGGAARILGAAHALEPGVAIRMIRLAHSLAKAEDEEGAKAILREVVNLESDTGSRYVALERLTALVDDRATRELTLIIEEREIAKGGADIASHLVVAELRRRARDVRGAAGAYREYLAQRPHDIEARSRYADLLAASGDKLAAVIEYGGLAEQFPRRSRGFLLRRADLLVELGRPDEAARELGRVEGGAGDVAAAHRDLAARWRRLGRLDEAARSLEHVLRLEPESVEDRLALVEVLLEVRWSRAREHLVIAFEHADAETRAKIVEKLYSTWRSAEAQAREMERLRKRAFDNPYDLVTPRLLAALYRERGEPGKAIRVLDRLVEARPLEPVLFEERAAVLAAAGRHADAVRDLELLRRLRAGEDESELLQDLIEANLGAGDVERALELSRATGGTLDAVDLLVEYGYVVQAIDVLTEVAAGEDATAETHKRLAELLTDQGLLLEAVAAWQEYEEAVGGDWTVALLVGDLYHELGDVLMVMVSGTRAVLEGDDGIRVERFFAEKGLIGEYQGLRGQKMRQNPYDADVIAKGVEALMKRRAGATIGVAVVRELRDLAIAEGGHPAGKTNVEWLATLRDHELEIYLRDRRAARARLKELRLRLGGEETRSEEEWLDYALLLTRGLRIWKSDWELLDRGLAEHPRSIPLWSAAARHALSGQHPHRAAEFFLSIEPLLAEPAHAAAVAAERERAWNDHLIATRRALPPGRVLELSSGDLESIARLDFDPRPSEAMRLLLPATEREVWRDAGVAFARTGKLDRARELIARLAPETDDALPEWIDLAVTYARAGLWEEAAEVRGLLDTIHRRISRDPRTADLEGWPRLYELYWNDMARHLESQGEMFEAYDLFRRAGADFAGGALLNRRAAHQLCATRYAEELTRLENELAADPKPGTLADLHDAALKLAEVRRVIPDLEGACDAYVTLVRYFPERFELVETLAQEASAGTGDELALRLQHAAIGAKLALEEPGHRTLPLGVLEPRTAAQNRARARFIHSGQISSTGQFGGRLGVQHTIRNGLSLLTTRVPGRGPNGVAENYLAVLRIELDAKEWSAARATFAGLVAAMEPLDGSERVALRTFIASYGRDVDVQAMLYWLDPEDESVVSRYTRAVILAGRFEEARSLLEELECSAAADQGWLKALLAERRNELEQAEDG